jgi:cytoskeletal protein CcmA (bactofilin family)
MKYKLMVMAGLFVLIGLFFAGSAYAAGPAMRTGDNPTVSKNETIDSSLYIAGSTITIAGTVRGDVYCAGQNITITGVVEGDVFCAGQTLQVNGKVGGARLAGQTITISGAVERSVTAFGQSVTIADTARVRRDATIYGANTVITGNIGRDIVSGGEQITVAGTIGRHANLVTQQVTVSGAGRIDGDLTYTSQNQVQIKDNGKVVGKSERIEPTHKEASPQSKWAEKFASTLYWFCALLLFGLALLAVLPKSFEGSEAVLVHRSGWSLLVGLSALIVTPIVVVLLLITLVGAPLGFVLLALWVSALVTSFVYSGHAVGMWVNQQLKWKPGWPHAVALAIGLALLALIGMVPILGGLLIFMTLVWGLGGIILATCDHVTGRDKVKKVKS